MPKSEDLNDTEAMVMKNQRNWEIVNDNWPDIIVENEDEDRLRLSFSSQEKKKMILPMFGMN